MYCQYIRLGICNTNDPRQVCLYHTYRDQSSRKKDRSYLDCRKKILQTDFYMYSVLYRGWHRDRYCKTLKLKLKTGLMKLNTNKQTLIAAAIQRCYPTISSVTLAVCGAPAHNTRATRRRARSTAIRNAAVNTAEIRWAKTNVTIVTIKCRTGPPILACRVT
jgi:hypothetical protein